MGIIICKASGAREWVGWEDEGDWWGLGWEGRRINQLWPRGVTTRYLSC